MGQGDRKEGRQGGDEGRGCLTLRLPPPDWRSEREKPCVPTPVVTAKSAETFDCAGVVWGCCVS